MTALDLTIAERLNELCVPFTTAANDAVVLFTKHGKLLLVVHTASKVVVGAIDVDQPLNPERFQR